MSLLYRKFTAESLDEIFGHTVTVKDLKKRTQAKDLPNVIMFVGEPGSGKTALANIIGKTITCSKPLPDRQPCNQCDNCKDVLDETYYKGVYLKNASRLNIDDVRKLEDEVMMSNPLSTTGNKVYIINEFQAMKKNPDAMQAMLMLLERKDIPNVYFILTSMSDDLPATVKKAISRRGKTYYLKKVESEDMFKLLAAIYKAETKLEITDNIQKLLMTIIFNAEGSVGIAFSMLETLIYSEINTEEELLSELNIISETKLMYAITSLFKGDAKLFFESISEINDEIYYKIRSSLVALLQYKMGVDIGGRAYYAKSYESKIELDPLNKLIEILNNIKAYPSATDYNYVFTQCLIYMKSVKPKEVKKERKPL